MFPALGGRGVNAHCTRPLAGRGRFLPMVALALVGGCSQPPVVLSKERRDPQEQRQKLLLSEADQVEVLAAMRSIAVGRTVVNPPAPAPLEMRWSDVPRAVAAACSEQGIEMAVVHTEVLMAVVHSKEAPYVYRFHLRTVEDWPGELIVCRVGGATVYVADGWIGRFPENPKHIEQKNNLLAALRRQMKAFGRKRGFNDPDE